MALGALAVPVVAVAVDGAAVALIAAPLPAFAAVEGDGALSSRAAAASSEDLVTAGSISAASTLTADSP